MYKYKYIPIIYILIILLFLQSNTRITEQKFAGQTSTTIPNNIGIQTHMINSPVNVNLIKDNGFKIVREDIRWANVEKLKNNYDYTIYDSFNQNLVKNNIRPYYTLGFSNPLYEENNSILTEEGRKAFVKFVEKTVKRYSNQNAIWEIWNEPNIESFWSPNFTSIDGYLKLVEETATVIKKYDKSGIIVAPALSGISSHSLLWLEESFNKGILTYIDAISVHPYRSENPETVIEDYKKLRKLISIYSDKHIPIISGEWGYSTALAWYGSKLTEKQQAEYLVRMLLVNLYSNVEISILYDWKNGGDNPDEGEQNFGIRKYNENTTKESAVALYNFSKTLNGYYFSKRVNTNKNSDYILEFKNNKDDSIYVYWTESESHHYNWPFLENLSWFYTNINGQSNKYWEKGNSELWFSSSPAYIKIEK
ncbi:glycoside hydrolase family 5 [Niallia taxi]|uniref:Glycoside hydrolase family 5 n=1 Tax=Niallia taxi TaxID=2499688 RepID=A0A3S2X421_9BACI|nr:glycoside hydrolase family 5 [Niallia taxi]RVT63844.1 glycoside hydrolase family 5 [Niallia taxi]